MTVILRTWKESEDICQTVVTEKSLSFNAILPYRYQIHWPASVIQKDGLSQMVTQDIKTIKGPSLCYFYNNLQAFAEKIPLFLPLPASRNGNVSNIKLTAGKKNIKKNVEILLEEWPWVRDNQLTTAAVFIHLHTMYIYTWFYVYVCDSIHVTTTTTTMVILVLHFYGLSLIMSCIRIKAQILVTSWVWTWDALWV